jgi:hypothetical protein
MNTYVFPAIAVVGLAVVLVGGYALLTDVTGPDETRDQIRLNRIHLRNLCDELELLGKARGCQQLRILMQFPHSPGNRMTSWSDNALIAIAFTVVIATATSRRPCLPRRGPKGR